ncbi:Triose-phosphate Transporter, partial [Cladochytrium tenue]
MLASVRDGDPNPDDNDLRGRGGDDNPAVPPQPQSPRKDRLGGRGLAASLLLRLSPTHLPRLLRPLPYIAAWFTTSLGLSVYNKFLFGRRHLDFEFPLLTSAVHMCVQFACAAAALRFLRPDLAPARAPPPVAFVTRVVPCALATALDI